jgi:ABC-type Na+ transport system ATPase subunit NatA
MVTIKLSIKNLDIEPELQKIAERFELSDLATRKGRTYNNGIRYKCEKNVFVYDCLADLC